MTMTIATEDLPAEVRQLLPLEAPDIHAVAMFAASLDDNPALRRMLAAALSNPDAVSEVGSSPIPVQARYHARMALMAGLNAAGGESFVLDCASVFSDGNWDNAPHGVQAAAERMYESVVREPADVPAPRLAGLIEFALIQFFFGLLKQPKPRPGRLPQPRRRRR